MAARIGVQESVLVDAQASLDAEREAAGLPREEIGTRAQRGKRKIVDLDMPERVFLDWKQYCALRDLTPAVLLRSLIHTLLSGPRNPTWTGKGWLYRGERLELTGYRQYMAQKREWPWAAKTMVTPGAARALQLRADATRAKPTGLVRGMVIDLLEGKLREWHLVPNVAIMWDDESRYWTGQH